MNEISLNRGRLRIIVRGVVQGVGFRPFVYGCAIRLGLGGLVGNESGGVFIEVEGTREALERFRRELLESPPPLSHLEEVTVEEIPGAPGSYNAVAHLRPWLQLEELTTSLRMVARIPQKA